VGILLYRHPVQRKSLKEACRHNSIATCKRMDHYDIACMWTRHTVYYIRECTHESLRMYTLCIFACVDMQDNIIMVQKWSTYCEHAWTCRSFFSRDEMRTYLLYFIRRAPLPFNHSLTLEIIIKIEEYNDRPITTRHTCAWKLTTIKNFKKWTSFFESI
jgi:hypothetical protein